WWGEQSDGGARGAGGPVWIVGAAGASAIGWRGHHRVWLPPRRERTAELAARYRGGSRSGSVVAHESHRADRLWTVVHSLCTFVRQRPATEWSHGRHVRQRSTGRAIHRRVAGPRCAA